MGRFEWSEYVYVPFKGLHIVQPGMTINISLQFNGSFNVSPQSAICSLYQHSILVAWLVQLSFIAQWIDGVEQPGCSLQASASMGFHVAISLPQELWKATPKLTHIKLPHQPLLVQFVCYFLKAEVGAWRWDLFSQVCIQLPLIIPGFFVLLGSWTKLRASLIPSEAARIQSPQQPYLIAFTSFTWAVLGNI